jgi:hypothetical protein
MKLTLYLIGVLAGAALAYPGMGNLIRELAHRQADDTTVQMIGDLVQRATTDVGTQIENCLTGAISCQDLTPKVTTLISIGSGQADFYLVICCPRPKQCSLPRGYMLRLGLHPK